MGQIIKYCISCDAGFAERFTFCPNCATKLQALESKPVIQPSRDLYSKDTLSDETAAESFARNLPASNKDQQERSRVSENGLSEEDHDDREYGGIGRLTYLVGICIFAFFLFASTSTSRRDLGDGPVIWNLILLGVFIWLSVLRLRNIGTSGLWVLMYIVPGLGLWTSYKCFVQQEGYEQSKELDGPGKVIRGIFLALLVFIGVAILAAFCARP